MQRRSFIQAGLFGLPLLAADLRAPGSIRALFVTDMHLSPDIARSKVAGDYLLDYIDKRPDIDIVINGGDAVYDVARLRYPAGEHLWQFWKEFRDRIRIPVYNCLGNHDIYEWELSAEAIAQPQESKSYALKHLAMPNNYYTFKAGQWKFIVLDSHTYVVKGYKGTLDEVQLKWLAAELATDRDYRTVIISHIPILSACASLYLSPEKNDLYPRIAERLVHTDAPFIFDAIKDRKVELFLHGHLHMQETIRYKQSAIYNGGAFCADMWKGPFHGFRSCFTLIDFPDSGGVKIKKIDLPATM